ncbi:MAG: FtsX-like permease family protein [Cyclobacteriaceae bacterium]
MLRNYLLTAYRNLMRNRAYTFLNIFGLAMGLGCVLVIYRYISHHTSFDKDQPTYERVYRVISQENRPTGIEYNDGVPHPVGGALRNDFPEMLAVAQTHFEYGGQINIKENDGSISKYEEEGIVFVEPTIFDVFDFNIIAGSPRLSLEDIDKAVITSSLAQKYFNLSEIAVGEAIGRTINFSSAVDLEIVGVIADRPETTDFPFTVLISYPSQKVTNPYYDEGDRFNSTSSATNCYVLLSKSDNPQNYAGRFPDFIKKYFGEDKVEDFSMSLMPLSEMHTNAEYQKYSGSSLPPDEQWALIAVAIILLIAGCINFINLATAQAVKRSKEIGVRKVLGSGRTRLVIQFLSETFIITIVSIMIGLVFAEVLLINLEEVLDLKLSIDIMNHPETIGFLILIAAVVTFLAGFYPSVLLSKMNPVLAIKNKISAQKHSGGISLRRLLVIIQFAISQVLIIGTIVVNSQMDFVRNAELGFNKDAIVTTFVPEPRDTEAIERIKKALDQNPNIESVAFGMGTPSSSNNAHSGISYAPMDTDAEYTANFKPIDENYLELFGLDLLAGRNMRRLDSGNVAIVNRHLIEWMGISEPEEAIGKTINTGYNGDKMIIGVVENFNVYSLHRGMDYVVFIKMSDFNYNMSVRLKTVGGRINNLDESLAAIESAWQEGFPDYIYDFNFYDEDLAREYQDEQATAKLLTLFSGIAIFIGCLGLYGLISFISTQKSKEIGVRKVLGASVWSVLGIFSRELMILLFIAFAIAAPLGYWLMDGWLSDFAYSIDITVVEFAIAIVFTIVIALVTMSYQSIRAAIANPVDSLKDE